MVIAQKERVFVYVLEESKIEGGERETDLLVHAH